MALQSEAKRLAARRKLADSDLVIGMWMYGDKLQVAAEWLSRIWIDICI